MLFGLIFAIYTAVYTLSSPSVVEQSGAAPENATFSFERSATTGVTGQMTAGNMTRLRLKNWDGCLIRSVVLQMRSNSKTGAGSLNMKIGKRTVWEIDNLPFDHQQWAGKFSTDWVNVSCDINVLVDNFEDIDITISATENSLYISRYTICYEPSIPMPYELSFCTGLDTCPSSITQSQIGEPLVLPAWKDTAIWFFKGWSEVEYVEPTNEVVNVLPAGSVYVPKKNTYLWAVYSDVDEQKAVVDYESGDYVLASRQPVTESVSGSGLGMCGKVKEGYVSLSNVGMDRNDEGIYCLHTPITEDMQYQITFDSDTTLSIMHVYTNTPVGYKDGNLSSVNSMWRYRILKDESLLIYSIYKNKTYVLCFGFDPYDKLNKDVVAYLQSVDIDKYVESALWIFPVMFPQYTSWPFGKLESVENILVPSTLEGGYIFYFGRYRLYIKDGKKFLLW